MLLILHQYHLNLLILKNLKILLFPNLHFHLKILLNLMLHYYHLNLLYHLHPKTLLSLKFLLNLTHLNFLMSPLILKLHLILKNLLFH